ncbi:glycine-rich domain-containing protein [Streptomyces gobiensis]|uniref:glycine-rich domain-containing protein n=1 Tax=Streptomyces gobiensis TaxID=2875706 RepID=UPI001E495599|nr:hypothetical protein [Streptomyces gobiensis]UGY92768.1 hypothetical protein test1122_14280 [Streptomyces gobiensis]
MSIPGPDARALLTDPEFDAVTATVMDNNTGMNYQMASRIVGQALAFVATAAHYRTARIAPSRVVDEGWHALILHTGTYARLCDRLGGMVHHYPERPDPERQTQQIIDRTTALMQEAGHPVDYDLWRVPAKELVPVTASCGHTPPGGCGPIGPTPRPGPGPGAQPVEDSSRYGGATDREVASGVD